MPLDKLGSNADDLIVSLRALSDTANDTLKPLGTQLPVVSKQLQTVLRNADRLMASLQTGYGANSDTHQNLQQITAEATKALRSVQDLTTYLNDHPGSVLWGRQ
jgi:paraquat-inducible protein B